MARPMHSLLAITSRPKGACVVCLKLNGPLFSGVCIPCDNQEQAEQANQRAQRLDERMPAWGLGRSRASLHRSALAHAYQARHGHQPDHELE